MYVYGLLSRMVNVIVFVDLLFLRLWVLFLREKEIDIIVSEGFMWEYSEVVWIIDFNVYGLFFCLGVWVSY